jgi:hypothetical protein
MEKNMKNRTIKKIILFVCSLSLIINCLAFGNPGKNQTEEELNQKKPFRIPKATSKIKIDGKMDEAEWQKALKLELNYEVIPGENISPPVRTEVFLLFSDTHFYAGFKAYDPEPSKVRARISDRDNYPTDGWVAIILDTFNDQRRTYNFYCNPFGVQGDLISSPEGGGGSWDAIWNSNGKLTDEGYVVEMAIPFSSLRFQHSKGDQVWGIDALRSYPRSVRHLIGLFPRDRSNNCYMCQSKKIIGFSGVKPGKSIELDPTLSYKFKQQRESFPAGKFIEADNKFDPGITLKWGITPNFTLNATANPDFSNVEADIMQLDINTKFALFYPEKRPFFLEGASLFTTRLRALHTRSFADPNWGVKFTGKKGGHAIGIFSVQDSITNITIPGSQGSNTTSLDMNSVGSVLRYRRDVGRSSTIGFLVSDREGDEYFNRVAGIDGDLRITKKDRIRFQFLGTQTQYPDQLATDYNQQKGDFWGTALDLFYYHDTRGLDWYMGYVDVSKDFRADLGYMPQCDYRDLNAGFGYTWYRNPGHWYTMINLGSEYRIQKDHDDNLLFEAYRFSLNYTGPLQSSLNMTANIGKRSYMGVEFDDNFLAIDGGFHLSGNLMLLFVGNFGDHIDYNNVRAGKQFMLEGLIQYRLGRRFTITLDQLYERLNIDEGRLYDANITYLKMKYQLNKRTFLRAILQYVDYKYNSELYTYSIDPRRKHLFTQFLFSYQINPQTVLFLGYSDNSYGFQAVPLTQWDRTAFIKIGYALVL